MEYIHIVKMQPSKTKILPNDYLRKNGVDCQPSALYPLEEKQVDLLLHFEASIWELGQWSLDLGFTEVKLNSKNIDFATLSIQHLLSTCPVHGDIAPFPSAMSLSVGANQNNHNKVLFIFSHFRPLKPTALQKLLDRIAGMVCTVKFIL